MVESEQGETELPDAAREARDGAPGVPARRELLREGCEAEGDSLLHVAQYHAAQRLRVRGHLPPQTLDVAAGIVQRQRAGALTEQRPAPEAEGRLLGEVDLVPPGVACAIARSMQSMLR